MENTTKRSTLNAEIENLSEQLRKIKENNAILKSLDEEKKKLSDMENSFFSRLFSYSSIRQLRTSIERTETVKKNFNLTTTSSKKVEELENKIKTLEDAKEDRNEFVLWKDYPGRLDKSIVERYMHRFTNLREKIHEYVPYVNITMFGGVGVGKSSFLNTVVTALMNQNKIYRDYKTAPSSTGKSKTKTFQLENMSMEGGKDLPIRFYDCPGIDHDEEKTMTLDVLEAVINGHVKGDAMFNPNDIKKKEGDCYKKNPKVKDVMHCIVYVIKATTNMHDPDNQTLKKIKAVQNRIDGQRDVKQVAIVTNIDQIGVPDVDMESVFKYGCVKEVCRDVSVFLEMDIHSVHPVANYGDEREPSDAKNALSLMALWNMFENGKRFIERKLERCFDEDN